VGKAPIPENGINLTPENVAALEYDYKLRVDTTGILPRDGLTLRNAALIRMVEESVERETHNAHLGFMGGFLSALGGIRRGGRA
jgi:hypothetical protein